MRGGLARSFPPASPHINISVADELEDAHACMQLSPHLLIAAYCQGIFPMAHDDGRIYWHDPDPRAIIPLDTLHVSKRLARVARSGRFDIRVDTAFQTVIAACAGVPRVGQEGTWIAPEMIAAYTSLHRLGFAHSVEAWREERLVGGLYGVAIRGLFAGESMFSYETDASKVCMVHLAERLRRGGFTLLDTQMVTPLTLSFGAIEIPRYAYRRLLKRALDVEASFLLFPANGGTIQPSSAPASNELDV